MRKSLGKIVAVTIASLLTITTASGCNSASSQSADSPAEGTSAVTQSSNSEEKATLTFWHTYGDAEEEQLKNVVLPMWNKLHPNITIDPVRQDSGQYNQMLITAFGTGQTPDVARIDIVNSASYAKQGGIVALDSMDKFSSIKDTCLEAPLSTNLYQGKYYGLPLDTNCKAAVVNTNKLKEIGLDKAPATLEEFITAAENKGGGKYLLSVSGVGDWDLYPYFWLFGGKLTDDGFTKASGYLDGSDSVKAIQTMIDLHSKKVLTIRDVDGSVDAWDGIKSGEFAMFFEGPWYFSSYDESSAQGIETALIPTYNGKSSSVVGGENIAIFEGSKNKQAAYEFLKFMVSEDAQLAMLEKGQLPVLKSLVSNAKVTENPVWSVYMKQLESAQARIPSPNHETIGQIWSDAMNNIFVNNADVQKELANAATLIDEQLAG